MERTRARYEERWKERQRREDELAALSAHVSAATAGWLELVWQLLEEGDSDDFVAFLAWRCGVTSREAREFVRVAEALQRLPGPGRRLAARTTSSPTTTSTGSRSARTRTETAAATSSTSATR